MSDDNRRFVVVSRDGKARAKVDMSTSVSVMRESLERAFPSQEFSMDDDALAGRGLVILGLISGSHPMTRRGLELLDATLIDDVEDKE